MRWLDTHAGWLGMVLAILCLVIWTVVLTGCGTSRDAQTKTVERLSTSTGPIVVETPIGNFTAQPVRHEMVRSQTEVSTEQTRIDAPEVGQLMQAAANSTPWGGIIGAITTAGAGYLALRRGKEAEQAKRHRDQLIDSVEAARDALPDDAENDIDGEFCKLLGKHQDKDLQTYIQQRTAP
jgi:hypothetical protein